MPKIPTIFARFKDDQAKRKKAKKEIDSLLELSSGKPKENYTNERVRLLDEGAITYSDGTIRFYITKGAIQNFYDNLASDYVGYISLAHADMYRMPLSLGYWMKEDLHLETDEDGRTHMDVDLHLNKDMHIVQDILSQEIELAVSADLGCHYDWDLSAKLNTPIVDQINIEGFAIVSNPGNAASGGIRLSEGEIMKLDEFKEKLSAVDQTLEPKEPEQPEEKEELSEEVQKFVQEVMDKYEALAAKYKEATDKIEELSGQVEELKKEEPKEPEEGNKEPEGKEPLENDPKKPDEDFIRQFLATVGTIASQGAEGKKPEDKPIDPVLGL